MVWFLKDHTYSRVPVLRRLVETPNSPFHLLGSAKCGPIGVDIDDNTVKLVQLACNGKSTSLIAGGIKNRPPNVKPGSGSWQRWVIEAIRELTADGKFRGGDVIAAMPAGEVFIDHIKMPKTKEGSGADDKMQDAIFSKIKQKLPVEPDGAMVKYIPAEQNNFVVMAVERTIVDRHLAIYENANLQIKSIGVWPIALINSYTRFFGRRKADIEAVVMLLQIDTNRTNVVICRHKNLLFARSIPIGTKQLANEETVGTSSPDKPQNGDPATRLVLELTACRQHFGSMYRKAQIERLIFLLCQTAAKDICAAIAKQLETPAQIGDCLAAVKIVDPSHSGMDRRNCQVNWATALGLSLS